MTQTRWLQDSGVHFPLEVVSSQCMFAFDPRSLSIRQNVALTVLNSTFTPQLSY